MDQAIAENKKRIIQSIAVANENNWFEKLEKIYEGIASGQCAGCTQCCSESVHTHYIEFLNIMNALKGDQEKYDRLLEKMENYYLEELHSINPCPMLDEAGRCEIYEVRPLVCRLFGHHSKEAHESHYRQVRSSNEEAKAYYKEIYDLEIPDEIVNRKIAYCEKFSIEKPSGKQVRIEMQEDILSLDSKFLMLELIGEECMDMGLVEWFIDAAHGDALFDEKIRRAKD